MLDKIYDPKPVEEKLTKLWHGNRLFISTVPEDKTKKPFVVVIPPPNITGALHMGHALNNTIQDVLVRFNRMQGQEAYWVPGTDHGGIATQNVIEKNLAKDKKISRHQMGRSKFLEYAWNWYKECGDTILSQLKKLGCSLDLTPENVRFTMDDKRAKAVFTAFEKLWDKKYIYRGKRMINWCVRCTTALSDIEVEHEEFKAKLYYVHYPSENGEGITVATTRPETMFGDTAICVNPTDKRYKNLIGKKVRLPLTDRYIPVIADKEIDLKFGTGALKITPAHDVTDYEIGKRHKLETINTISPEGEMINVAKKYLGLKREQCRKIVIEDLKEQGFLKEEKPYKHSVGICYRCHQPIEPAISEQWFVKMKHLAEPAVKVIKDDKVKLHPISWKKPMLKWLENIEDWCISRQIWWGHRIPVWYCKKCSSKGLIFNDAGELARVDFTKGVTPIISFEKPTKCTDCKSDDLIQDPDVLDTWFSSGLWPFSVFNWPEKTKELDYYYPTNVLCTGYEILYLWVARMIMMGLEFMGEIPFTDVYLHGIVRDKTGKKMSKSLGNVIDPVDLIDKYGTDAVRFSLISQSYVGKDIPFGEESIVGARNFCNKIYNTARFVLMNLPEDKKILELPKSDKMDLSDKWILDRYNKVISGTHSKFKSFDFADVSNTLYHFLWGDFCDWYLEIAKPRLQTEEKENVLAILVYVLYGTLKALHPIMPFITEELADNLRPCIDSNAKFLLEEKYPKADKTKFNNKAAQEMNLLMAVISELRKIRSQFNITSNINIDVVLVSAGKEHLQTLEKHSNYINLLAKINELKIIEKSKKPAHSAMFVLSNVKGYVLLEGKIDFEKEKDRLLKERTKLLEKLEYYGAQLKNEKFINNAPKEQIEKVKTNLKETELKNSEIKTALEDLK
ncbi:MAG TPA: valine--tRNA ligase [Elusimicrobiales bacterium]|nr:valine--tRNA ligase [Elusimicrobiales bacterium]